MEKRRIIAQEKKKAEHKLRSILRKKRKNSRSLGLQILPTFGAFGWVRMKILLWLSLFYSKKEMEEWYFKPLGY